MNNKIETMDQLRERLCAAFVALEGDRRKVIEAKELANLAGKIIQTCAVTVVYAQSRGEDAEIPFLGEFTKKAKGRTLSDPQNSDPSPLQ